MWVHFQTNMASYQHDCPCIIHNTQFLILCSYCTIMKPIKFRLLLLLLLLAFTAESYCTKTCDVALASYNIQIGSNLTYISSIMISKVVSEPEDIFSYNKDTLQSPNSLLGDSRVNVPFTCDCINNEFLGHTFLYELHQGDTYASIAAFTFSNLTNEEGMQRFNVYSPDNIPVDGTLNVTVNCSCGNREVSKDYGLFITYPLTSKDTLESIAKDTKLDAELLQRYNPGVNFSQGTGLVFIPGKGSGAIAGISVGVLAGILLSSFGVYVKYYLKKKAWKKNLTLDDSKMMNSAQIGTEITGLLVEKSQEFSYKELSIATNKFSMSNKIGEGGFGEVFYAELRGQKAAIKKMRMKASKEFCAELKVLTCVHHLNLVGLIGYCVEGFLFLVYEYIDNGNLSQNLRDSERESLTWSTRMQIALDSARALEYIHEHTVHGYIHRDIKSENILLDKRFRAKVTDFGLSKFADVENSTSSNKIVQGTFGYMPPEYARGGVAPSPKIDVYAFGVVLYELISAKQAVIRDGPEVKGLVALFDEVFDHETNPTEALKNLVDPRLGDNYSVDSVCNIAKLAKACTMKDPQFRPSMRSVVVALTTLTSTTEDWNVSSFFENPAFVNLMSGK
ncbi:lysM domain receptor-like kinase 3 isoform X2 [Trifolium pratense]|uniref:lysM domain receptor-like kinase 3 isoform X2 n=1 Tax=Trifolium pratense TaxID=57577 RepID=UPI001E6961AB|nr:lysM domain receptor-like kinase 3 isoform X2 [Trifolium pratense]